VAPFFIAPKAGKLADRIGERPLVVSGLLLQAAGFAWIAIIAAPRLPYPALLAPMMVSGAGIGLALPAVTKAVVGSVPHGDIGKASGSFSMMRQLGGAFGIAILAAVFTAAGGYTSATAFSAGFAPALAAAAGLALAGVPAGLALPGRPDNAGHLLAEPAAARALGRAVCAGLAGDSEAVRDRGGFHPAVDAQLGQDVGNVHAGGLGADEQGAGDLGVRPARGQQHEYFAFAAGEPEPGQFIGRRRLPGLPRLRCLLRAGRGGRKAQACPAGQGSGLSRKRLRAEPVRGRVCLLHGSGRGIPVIDGHVCLGEP
jgi:hypothetical protein